MTKRSWLIIFLACGLVGLGILWWTNRGQELATLRGHESVVRAVAFAPGGEVLATGSDDQTIKIWSTVSNRLLRTLEGHSGKVRAIAFSVKQSMLASAGDDKTIRLWDWNSGKELASWNGSEKTIESLAFSEDGEVLASAGVDRVIRLWTVADRSLRKTLEGHNKHVHGLCFVPSSRQLISGGEDGQLLLWEWETGESRPLLKDNRQPIHSMSLSAKGDTLAAALTGKGILRFAGPSLSEMPALANSGMVRGVALNPTGKILASTHEDKTVKVWNLESGALLATFAGHSGVPFAASFAPDGKSFVTAGGDGLVKRWPAP
jgi:WD40 repeat protein